MRPVPLQWRNVRQRIPIHHHHHQIRKRPAAIVPICPVIWHNSAPTTVAELMISAGVSTLARSSNSMQWYFPEPTQQVRAEGHSEAGVAHDC